MLMGGGAGLSPLWLLARAVADAADAALTDSGCLMPLDAAAGGGAAVAPPAALASRRRRRRSSSLSLLLSLPLPPLLAEGAKPPRDALSSPSMPDVSPGVGSGESPPYTEPVLGVREPRPAPPPRPRPRARVAARPRDLPAMPPAMRGGGRGELQRAAA